MNKQELKKIIKEVISEKLEPNDEKQIGSLMALEPNGDEGLLNSVKSMIGSINGILAKYQNLSNEFRETLKDILIIKLSSSTGLDTPSDGLDTVSEPDIEPVQLREVYRNFKRLIK